MTAAERRSREITRREDSILDAAASILATEGYPALTMHRLGEAIEFSRATIYQHYSAKEDVVAALVVRAMRTRVADVERVLALSLPTRETALALLLVAERQAHADRGVGQVLDQLLYRGGIVDKADPARIGELAALRRRVFELVGSVVARAKADADLPPTADPFTLAFALWSLAHGAASVGGDEQGLWPARTSPAAALRAGFHAMLDGFGWKPGTLEHDWAGAEAKVRALIDVFPGIPPNPV
jgi:AcrR family transcriptional regulator